MVNLVDYPEEEQMTTSTERATTRTRTKTGRRPTPEPADPKFITPKEVTERIVQRGEDQARLNRHIRELGLKWG
jgi:hypothetical protein